MSFSMGFSLFSVAFQMLGSVLACSAASFENCEPSFERLKNANCNSSKLIFPSDANFLTWLSDTPNCFANSRMIGMPASTNWLISSAYKTPAVRALPYMIESSEKSLPVAREMRAIRFRTSGNLSALSPNASRLCPALNTSSAFRMFLFASPCRSVTRRAAFSASPVKAVNDFCARSNCTDKSTAVRVSLTTWSIKKRITVAFPIFPNASFTTSAAKLPSLPIFFRFTPTALPVCSSFFRPVSAFASSFV